ncbi:MAG: methionyl-tRNA formyltransferase [Alphaproteobacteria bacterium]
MRVVFMGTPDFSVPALAALIDAGHEIVCVYSQPPRPAGRGHKEKPSPVQAFAESRGLAVRYPASFKDANTLAAFAALDADVAVVAAYGLILPKAVLEAPRLGCINIHASLLPRWRGAVPIQRAILAGDTETGITIMQMDEGLDTGPMLMTEAVPIAGSTTASELHDTLAEIGGRLIVEVLSGEMPPAVPQPDKGATYASKLDRAEGRIDWTQSAVELDRRVRALNPWPGVWCERDGERLRVLAAAPVDGNGAPGTVIAGPLTVACGDGALKIKRVQRAGKSAMPAEDYVRGNPAATGTVLA